MRKIYIDRNSVPGPTSVWIKDAEVLWAGTVISSMPETYKDERYKKIALEYDVHFIFDDKIPVVNFYAVPMLKFLPLTVLVVILAPLEKQRI